MEAPAGTGQTGGLRRGNERRRWMRYACEGFSEVAIFEPEALLRGQIRNLSEHGCFVETRARVYAELRAVASVRFNLQNRQYRVLARVANVRPGEGVGFEFQFEDARMETEIRHLVQELDGIEQRAAATGTVVRRNRTAPGTF